MMIPYGRQDISQADIDSVVEVLRSDFLTQGPTISRFEQAVANQVGAKYAVAVNSATSALHVACLALGLGPGDRLWTVPNTFVASANCGRYCGAEVDFVDIDPDTWNISVKSLREKLIFARERKTLPKVLVPVHFSGQPTDQEDIWDLAQEFGFKVLEDASHAIGASHRGEMVGSCRWSDITVFSFHPVKIITTGEGGLALTNSELIAERMALFRSHGITRDIRHFRSMTSVINECPITQEAPAAWYYEQQELGYNYRMTDLQAALGISQLTRLKSYVEQRNLLACRYNAAFNSLPLSLPTILSHNVSAFHLYVVRIQPENIVKSHRKIFDEFRSKGLGVNMHYIPVHLQPYYQDLGFSVGQFPEAEAYCTQAISLPLFPALTFDQQDYVVSVVHEVINSV